MVTPAEKRLLRDKLSRRFRATWARIGASGASDKAFATLIARYDEPHRHYHTVEHLKHCMSMFDAVRGIAQDADMIEAALWWHDENYDVGSLATGKSTGNEAKSAMSMVSVLAAAGVAPARVERASKHVLATAKHGPSDDPDTDLMVDIDLAILGVSPAGYDKFERQIRLEYAWVPEETFRSTRAGILATFLPNPYKTAFFRDRYAEPAKFNLERTIAALKGEVDLAANTPAAIAARNTELKQS